MTSKWEGFGNVIVEALVNGLRVISTDCPSGPSEILCNGSYGKLVPVADVNALVSAYEETIQGSELNEPFDSKFLKHLKKFTLDVVSEEYLSILD